MSLAILSALVGAIAATSFLVVAVSFAIYLLINLYAGEAALPALFKLLRDGVSEKRERSAI